MSRVFILLLAHVRLLCAALTHDHAHGSHRKSALDSARPRGFLRVPALARSSRLSELAIGSATHALSVSGHGGSHTRLPSHVVCDESDVQTPHATPRLQLHMHLTRAHTHTHTLTIVHFIITEPCSSSRRIPERGPSTHARTHTRARHTPSNCANTPRIMPDLAAPARAPAPWPPLLTRTHLLLATLACP